MDDTTFWYDLQVWLTAFFLYAPTIYFVARYMFFHDVRWTNAERILFAISILLVILAAAKHSQ